MRVSNEQLRRAVEQAQLAHPQGFHQFMWTDLKNHAEGPCAYDLALDLANDRDKLHRVDVMLQQARDLLASEGRINDTSRSDRAALLHIVRAVADADPTCQHGTRCALCAGMMDDNQGELLHEFNCPWIRAHLWVKENDRDRVY